MTALVSSGLARQDLGESDGICLEHRKLLYQFADQYYELSNKCGCQITNSYTGEVEIIRDCRPVVYAGDSVARALVHQSAMPGMQVGGQVYLNLPLKPAIQIDRRVASAGAKKDNRPIEVEQTLCLVGGKWWYSVGPETPRTEYRFLATILHRASDNRHALIANSDRVSGDYFDEDPSKPHRWIPLEMGADPKELQGAAAHRLIDGDGTDGYNAVLAFYTSKAATGEDWT
jgi:hypothetical protein